jgi:hypothetical protein
MWLGRNAVYLAQPAEMRRNHVIGYCTLATLELVAYCKVSLGQSDTFLHSSR